ncbi:phage/plasmid replication protein, II/X family [Noviherbaspirillum sp.]|uniref:phage/plasmid replication protein, II/X family n=1 Tax=Noviherbaspirillum sp. TaxID=1926288 RepID=UPI002B46F877|nr:phage/plasmid replication protein, II/X family [Noviherbaspirillum sp.]HJV82447.1 phage/plasmid replication protein, II/X family [Noviherbaspirillum sp.]
MPLDTVKLRSPTLPKATINRIEGMGIKTQRTDMQTGLIEMEFTRTPLRGSWDSRISLAPCHSDLSKNPITGRVEEHPCPPYVYLECSFPKNLNGHNVFGGPTDLPLSARVLIEAVSDQLGVKLPPADTWWVHRVDWAENYVLGFDAIQDFFATMKNARFPRRNVQSYGTNGLYAAGITTTVKLYHKGEEFAEHDFKRIERSLRNLRTAQYPQDRHIVENRQWVEDQITMLQDEANRRLRVEVEIHLEKLKHDFGHKPFVKEVKTDYLTAVFDKEVYRLMRQGKTAGTTILRNSTAVLRRLADEHQSELANKLHAFWNQMATVGEKETKAAYPRATFYRHRKMLEEAGITWHQADSRLIERTDTSLPDDFQLIRSDPRRCTREVIEGTPVFNQWGNLKQAA